MEKEIREIRFCSTSTYMASYSLLTYITIGLIGLSILHIGMISFSVLPASFLLMQWSQFKKKAGKVALIVSPKGIKNSWEDMEWKDIREAKIEAFTRQRDITFVHQKENGPERVYRYRLAELDITSEEYYSLINAYKPIELITQHHQS